MLDRRDFRPRGWIWGAATTELAGTLKDLKDRGLMDARGAIAGLLLAAGATPVARSAERDAMVAVFEDRERDPSFWVAFSMCTPKPRNLPKGGSALPQSTRTLMISACALCESLLPHSLRLIQTVGGQK